MTAPEHYLAHACQGTLSPPTGQYDVFLSPARNGEQRDAIGTGGIDEGRELPSSCGIAADEQEQWLGAVIVGIDGNAPHLSIIAGARSRHDAGMVMPFPEVVGTLPRVPQSVEPRL
jgi:hypothetical protein